MNSDKQNGISLLEIMLGLTVVAAVVIMSTVYYHHTQENQRQSQLISQVSAITQAAHNYMRNRSLTPSTMSTAKLVSDGGLSPLYTKSPWGKDVTVKVVQTSQVEMTIPGIPEEGCSAVKTILDRSIRTTGTNPESITCRPGIKSKSLVATYDVF